MRRQDPADVKTVKLKPDDDLLGRLLRAKCLLERAGFHFHGSYSPRGMEETLWGLLFRRRRGKRDERFCLNANTLSSLPRGVAELAQGQGEASQRAQAC